MASDSLVKRRGRVGELGNEEVRVPLCLFRAADSWRSVGDPGGDTEYGPVGEGGDIVGW